MRRTRRRRRQLFAATAALSLTVGVPGIYFGARALMRGRPAAPMAPSAPTMGPVKPAVAAGVPAVLPARLDVGSDPPGARVVVDGRPRGVTPVALSGLARGEHQVRVESNGRSVTQAVLLEPARTATLFVPFRATAATAAGWLVVTSPVELQVYEDGDLIGTSRTGRMMLPPGQHTVALANEAIGFRATRDVEVSFGGTATLDVAIPNGRADINAAPWAEVWIDGEKAGDTPLAGFVVAPGRHTVIFRHPRLGERSVDCFVTLREPLRLSADLTK